MNRHAFPSLLPCGCLALALLAGWAVTARADEIVYRDVDTCETVTLRVHDVVSETWTEVTFRERPRAPSRAIPTFLVQRVVREDGDARSRSLRNAIGELERGNTTEARRMLQALCGGGWQQNLELDRREYRPFTRNDPPGRSRRPDWVSEYSHFFYAKALFLEGTAKESTELLEEAWLALEDQPLPDGAEGTTGGFLERFKGGNSRWYPEAMLLKARILLARGRNADARAAFQDLYDSTVSVQIGPRWAFEAKIGPGAVAEAEERPTEAVNAYIDAQNAMLRELEREQRPCVLRELGRYVSLARVRAAAVKLAQAEEHRSAGEFRQLRTFIEEGSPEALQERHRSLGQAQRAALVAGAMDPAVQAVYRNGMGVAYLYEEQYEAAILAFRAVEVQYFEVPAERSRALYYLAWAADRAAEGARGEAQTLYQSWRDAALERLRADYPRSPWIDQWPPRQN